MPWVWTLPAFLCFLFGMWDGYRMGYRMGAFRAVVDLLEPGQTYCIRKLTVTNCEASPGDEDPT